MGRSLRKVYEGQEEDIRRDAVIPGNPLDSSLQRKYKWVDGGAWLRLLHSLGLTDAELWHSNGHKDTEQILRETGKEILRWLAEGVVSIEGVEAFATESQVENAKLFFALKEEVKALKEEVQLYRAEKAIRKEEVRFLATHFHSRLIA